MARVATSSDLVTIDGCDAGVQDPHDSSCEDLRGVLQEVMVSVQQVITSHVVDDVRLHPKVLDGLAAGGAHTKRPS